MIEVYYLAPPDADHEAQIAQAAQRHGGEITFREIPKPNDLSQAVVLTIEFESWAAAEQAMSDLQAMGEYVEGPCEYGDD
jgi:hypothetical protein